MGTSGARKGFKIFSINTTVRNPLRNDDFLKIFLPYNNKVFDSKTKLEFYKLLIRNKVYKSIHLTQRIQDKYLKGEALEDYEVNEILKLNPQKTGFEGRSMTQLRALKDQGLLIFEGKVKTPIIKLSKLADDYLRNKVTPANLYSKLFLGLHSNNPQRRSLFNKSRPFLNMIFVMNELKRIFGNERISFLEFGVFVLTMKDCDFKSVTTEIEKYRKKNGFKFNKNDINFYLNKNNTVIYTQKTILDYADEVFRKFEMTDLVSESRNPAIRFINYKHFNSVKINLILSSDNYEFFDFIANKDYEDFLYSYQLPWMNEEAQRKLVIDKSKKLNINLDSLKSSNETNLIEQESELDKLYSNNIIKKIISDYDFIFLEKELNILSGRDNSTSKFDDKIPEPLRLEYLLSLLMGVKFGTNILLPNLILSEDGFPISHAPGNKPDIVFESPSSNNAIILEPTMIRNRAQQENNETTTVARHLNDIKKLRKKLYRGTMIAPYIHRDTLQFFLFTSQKEDVKLIPMSIGFFLKILMTEKSNQFDEFIVNFDNFFDEIKKLSFDDILLVINNDNSPYINKFFSHTHG
jgi:hypothetical protein